MREHGARKRERGKESDNVRAQLFDSIVRMLTPLCTCSLAFSGHHHNNRKRKLQYQTKIFFSYVQHVKKTYIVQTSNLIFNFKQIK